MNVKASTSKGLRKSMKRKCKLDDEKKAIGATLSNILVINHIITWINSQYYVWVLKSYLQMKLKIQKSWHTDVVEWVLASWTWAVFKRPLINGRTYHVGISVMVDGSNEQQRKVHWENGEGIKWKGSYRRMVQKGMKGVKEQEGREIGLNERGVKLKNKVHKKECRERSRIHGWVKGLTWN